MSTTAATATPDATKRSRRGYRTQLVKRINDLTAELSRETPDQTVVQVKLQTLEQCYEKVSSLDQKIIEILNRDASEEQDDELLSVSEYEKKYRTAKVKANNFLEDGVTSSNHSFRSASPGPHAAHSSKKTYKLPKIEIAKFSGDLKDWLGFWSQFQKIHEDSALHANDKFQYLVQSMVPGSRAHTLVHSYPQTAANYPLVIAALKDRFGDKVLLTEVHVYVRQLLKLVIRNVSKHKSASLSAMYDKLESHLRAIETLGVTQEQSAAFLYPLVESSLPEEIVKAWQRSAMSGYEQSDSDKPVDERLKSLMKFLRMEVKGAERLAYVSEGFGEPVKEKSAKDRKATSTHSSIPTSAGLLAGNKGVCIFCDKSHDSQTCVSAQTMSYGLKKRKIMDKKACLSCLKIGHMAKACKLYTRCLVCQKKHVSLMCPDLDVNIRAADDVKPTSNNTEQTVNSQLNCTNEVLLQTLRCTIRSESKQKEVRVLLDPGSQKSYILEKTAKQLGLRSREEVRLCHLLFGGLKEVQPHNLYEIEIKGSHNNFRSDLKVLGHEQICSGIPSMSKGPWMAELKEKKIFVSDLRGGGDEIELLIGSDYYGQWLTGVCRMA